MEAGCAAVALILLSIGSVGPETWRAFIATASASHAMYESGRILFGQTGTQLRHLARCIFAKRFEDHAR